MNGEKVFFCNYSIGTDTWKEVPSVCGLYGKRILLIGGKKALHAGKEHLVQAIAETCMELVETVIFGEDCTYEYSSLGGICKRKTGGYDLWYGWRKRVGYGKRSRIRDWTSSFYVSDDRGDLCGNNGAFCCI